MSPLCRATCAPNASRAQSIPTFSGYYKCCYDEADGDSLFELYRDAKRQCLREYWANQTGTHYSAARQRTEQTIVKHPVHTYAMPFIGYRSHHHHYDMFSAASINRTREEYICVSECVARLINIVGVSRGFLLCFVSYKCVTGVVSYRWTPTAISLRTRCATTRWT